jgi:hypothetical protein
VVGEWPAGIEQQAMRQDADRSRIRIGLVEDLARAGRLEEYIDEYVE